MTTVRKIIKKVLRSIGYDLVKVQPLSAQRPFPADFDETTVATIETVAPYTMTSAERLFALCSAVRYVSRCRIPGDIVECGVWKGGSMMAVARTLLENGDGNRELHLFDTFEGMAPPQDCDISVTGVAAAEIMATLTDNDEKWCFATIDEVRSALESTTYDPTRLHYIKGRVEDTIPEHAPERIALLRLDTDWYESTKHELEHLFPRLVDGGVIIIDDYGFWRGCRVAVDEYLADNNIPVLLNRIDDTARIGVLPISDSNA